jgi:hypothetical protein
MVQIKQIGAYRTDTERYIDVTIKYSINKEVYKNVNIKVYKK